MPMATFCCMEHAQNHANQSPPMTGHCMVAVLNLNLLTYYICTIRCQQLTSTPFLIYGQHLYSKQAGVLCFPTTKRCMKQSMILNLGMLSGSPSLWNIMETQDLILCLGCRMTMTFGFRIPMKLHATCWQIQTLLMKWTTSHSMSMTRRLQHGSGRTSCQGIGHGTKL